MIFRFKKSAFMFEILKTFLFLFAVIDPLGSVPVYLEASKKFSNDEKKAIAIRASLIAFFVLLFFIVAGQIIMEIMNVSLDAFQITGGVVLFLFALTMIFGEGKPESEKHMIQDYKHVTIFPIALPSIASPGAIMAVVLMTDNHIYSLKEQLITTILVLLVISITCVFLLFAKILRHKIGETGITVVSKVMGLLLASYAVQSILSGLKAFFNL